MPADLADEIALRNARFRAWREYGVPVAEGWGSDPDRGEEGGYSVFLYCRECDLYGHDFLARGDIDAARLQGAERNAVEEARRMGCRHLDPLLGEDPPEVVALTKLELLAGDPPR
jgi:hypothetical protein